ncbi:cysteine hydrolase family protein [Sulfurospirillum arcachonense]|uniref:cysteine hydrolase family protein n=1 Tax=Sulfurospirillum arcachonense TaxID=57666 RepID=UPI000468B53B|nr:isochorismatase family protein [Sulfurospirillum arcachonense]
MNTALLIIDVQQSLVDEGIWQANKVINQLNKLSTLAREQSIPVILIRDTRVLPDGTFHNLLKQENHDIEIIKSFCDSFMQTNLEEILKNNNITRLIIGGLQSDFCIDTTCREAAKMGYDVVLVSDAHSTLNHEHLNAEQIVAHHNRILRNFDSANGKVRVLKSSNIAFSPNY